VARGIPKVESCTFVTICYRERTQSQSLRKLIRQEIEPSALALISGWVATTQNGTPEARGDGHITRARSDVWFRLVCKAHLGALVVVPVPRFVESHEPHHYQ